MTDQLCAYSDLPTGQCHHCDPTTRPGDPTKAARLTREQAERDSVGNGRWGRRRGKATS